MGDELWAEFQGICTLSALDLDVFACEREVFRVAEPGNGFALPGEAKPAAPLANSRERGCSSQPSSPSSSSTGQPSLACVAPEINTST